MEQKISGIRLIILSIIFSFIIGLANATNYYVKNGGNDSADGLTDSTAWETIGKVNLSILAGDSIFFKRGDQWRDQIISVSGASGNHTYYGAYGVGIKPLILGSVEKNNESDWTNVYGNIWTSEIGSFPVDVGNLIFNGEESFGVKIMSATPVLDCQGEFWYDYTDDLIQLYSVGNPALYYNDIECAITKNVILHKNKDYVTYQYLDICYGGAHGMGASGGSSYVNVFDCNFSYIGGGDLSGIYTTRYGNGVEFWSASHDCYVERCNFDNIYDAAISPQGGEGTYEVYNQYYRNNIISNSEYSYEIFWHDDNANAHDIYFENNTCLYAGGGWSHFQRPDGVMADHVRLGSLDAVCNDIYIRNNIFYLSTERIICYYNATDLAKVNLDYNNYYVEPGSIYGYRVDGGALKTYSLDDWQILSSQETNAVDGNPMLKDVENWNFHLTYASPVIGEGLDLGSDSDYDGVYWRNPPSIGAYEFTYEFPESITPYDLKNANINFFPNPVNDILNIKSDREFSLRIYNLYGSLIIKSENHNTIDLKGLVPGIYVVEITSFSDILKNKFIKL